MNLKKELRCAKHDCAMRITKTGKRYCVECEKEGFRRMNARLNKWFRKQELFGR